jgi:hypothetical protein
MAQVCWVSRWHLVSSVMISITVRGIGSRIWEAMNPTNTITKQMPPRTYQSLSGLYPLILAIALPVLHDPLGFQVGLTKAQPEEAGHYQVADTFEPAHCIFQTVTAAVWAISF